MILFVEGLKFFQRLCGDSHTADDYQSTTVVWMARARIVKTATAISITFSAFSLVHLVTVLLNSHLKMVLWTNSCFFPSFQNGSMLGESWTIYQELPPRHVIVFIPWYIACWLLRPKEFEISIFEIVVKARDHSFL